MSMNRKINYNERNDRNIADCDHLATHNEPVKKVSSDDLSSQSHQVSPPKTANASCDHLALSRRGGAVSHKLSRGISRTQDNLALVSQVRSQLQSGLDQTCDLRESSEHSFILPDLTKYTEELCTYLERELIELSSYAALEDAGRLNWWSKQAPCQKLYPMATTGDGNCLLHAASLAMWGVHDRELILRTALHNELKRIKVGSPMWRRWRWAQTITNKQYGLVCSEEEWNREWDNLLHLSSTEPRVKRLEKETVQENSDEHCHRRYSGVSSSSGSSSSPVWYESLEEFHVFVLTHVLRRPVIIVADTVLRDSNGEALAPIPFGGVYLPLECPSEECHHRPLVLTYDSAHFSALVPMETDVDDVMKTVIPLTHPDHSLLPIHFAVDPGPHFQWGKDDLDEGIEERFALSVRQQLLFLYTHLDIITIPLYVDAVLDVQRMTLNDWNSSAGSDSAHSASGKENGTLPKKTLKRRRSLSKQLGSIGKMVGNKLKKAFQPKKKDKHSYSPVGGQLDLESELRPDQIFAAELNTQRPTYQEEMVKNYLSSAHERFLHEKDYKQRRLAELMQHSPSSNGHIICQEVGCNNIASAATEYRCSQCSTHRAKISKDNASAIPLPVQTGNSKFYTKEHGYPVLLEYKGGTLGRNTTSSSQRRDCRTLSNQGHTTDSAARPGWELCKPADLIDLSSSESSVSELSRKSSPEKNVRRSESPKVVNNNAQLHRRCRGNRCEYYGSDVHGGYCSTCYKRLNLGNRPEEYRV